MSSEPAEKNITQNSGPEISEKEIKNALELMLSNRIFAQSDRMARFLRYIVEVTLAGQSDRLKEYPIALEAFDRDDTFDPQTSSLVRVEAGRLRTKLHEYHASDGADAAVIIDLPRGGYVPTFARRRPVEGTAAALPSPIIMAADNPARKSFIAGAIVVLIVISGAVLWLAQPTVPTEQSNKFAPQAAIAVLPLQNLTGDPAQDYLSYGMTDAIISHLAKSHRLRVASMTSVTHFTNTSKSITEIGRKLGVKHLVEGSVKRDGNIVQIAAKLIEAKSNRLIWSQTFQRPLSEIVALQDEVARKVRQSLIGRLVVKSSVAKDPTGAVQPEAYEAYLRGRFFRNKVSASGFYKATSYFKHAISIAPNYAPAFAELAGCYCLLGGHGFELVNPVQGMPLAKKAAQSALRIDNTLAEPYTYLGIIRLKYDWDWKGAEQYLKRSIELKPNFDLAHVFYSLYLEAMGSHDDAVRQAEIARTINPLSLRVQVNLGWQYLQAGTLERARRQFENVLELEPEFWGAHWALGHYYRRQGNMVRAIASFKRAVSSKGGHVLPLSDLGYAYAVSGRSEDANTILKKLKVIERGAYVSPFRYATIYAGLSEDRKALEQLERAYKHRSRSLAWLNVMPEYDRLRKSPGFQALISKIGLPRRDN